jgi:hypothetical protein
MVVIKDIKKCNTLYGCFKNIILTNDNASISVNRIISFNESDLEIEIETYIPFDNLHRGWVGDIYYETDRGIDADTCENVNKVYQKKIKDVLLARVNLRHESPDCVIFTYTFLKY